MTVEKSDARRVATGHQVSFQGQPIKLNQRFDPVLFAKAITRRGKKPLTDRLKRLAELEKKHGL